MPEIIETTVYRLDELSDTAKDKARAWYREGGFDYDWYDAVYEDFQRIAEILGICLKTRPVRLMGGGTRREPLISFTGFWSQGDGASYQAFYAFRKNATREIREHAPQDTRLHAIYFAFSTVIMQALDRIGPQAGMAAMVSINEMILRTAFIPLFFGTSLASLCLLILAVSDISRTGAMLTALAALVYLAGMFGSTLVFNVPLNNMLAQAVTRPDAAVQWSLYLRDWTTWNHVRTVSSVLAAILFTAALALR